MLLTFKRAEKSDLSIVLSILDDAAAWLTGSGIEQWPDKFSGADDWRTARIEEYVSAGHTFIVWHGVEPVGTFTLGGPDPDYADGWPEGPGNAVYIFRMAVRRRWSGQDIGSRVLNWASAYTKRDDKHWLRLDCSRDNRALQQYYELRGFQRVATLVRSINHGEYTRRSGALYQRAAGTIMPFGKDGQLTEIYDPTGEAGIWDRAVQIVNSLVRQEGSADEVATWNAAISQAARVLENESRAVRQRDGMYFRVITGSGYEPPE